MSNKAATTFAVAPTILKIALLNRRVTHMTPPRLSAAVYDWARGKLE
jgi:hypothetical protein